MKKIFLAAMFINLSIAQIMFCRKIGEVELKTEHSNNTQELTKRLFIALYEVGARNQPTVFQPESNESIQSIIQLIDDGAQVNAFDKGGQTPLMLASKKGLLPVVQALLKKGANVNYRDNKGDTALIRGLEAFSYHKRYQEHFIIKYLVNAGAHLNIFVKKGNVMMTPLMILFSYSNELRGELDRDNALNIAKLFLEHDADPNAKDNAEKTVLQYAAAWGPEAEELVREFQEKKKKVLEVTTTELNTHTPMYQAVTSVVQEYMQAPTGTKAFLQQIKSAIHDNDFNTLKLLMVDPDNLERADAQGYTPLLEAVYSNNVQAVRILLDLGADTQARLGADKTGLNAIELANHVAKVREFKGVEAKKNEAIIAMLSKK